MTDHQNPGKEKRHLLSRKELQKQSNLKNLIAACLVFLLIFSLLVIRVIFLKRKNEKLREQQDRSALQQKTLELEMQALRAQMNPHFIFNCLSAIDNLVQTSQTDKATTYLARFARLIRGVLDSSKNNMVPFQKDLETLQLYLQLEQFRCNNKFSYTVNVDSQLMNGDFMVPPLIIQPFVENAIHHGLLNKQSQDRRLVVEANYQEGRIIYTITDNGIGRKLSSVINEANRPGHRSYGISITKERVHLHNKNGIDDDIQISDLEEEGHPSGTKAVICIHNW